MIKPAESSISVLHQRWAKLEGKHCELALALVEVETESACLASMRERQATLLLEIEALKAEIRRRSPTSIEDILALLDIVLEHETDLAGDIAEVGLMDYPMTAQ